LPPAKKEARHDPGILEAIMTETEIWRNALESTTDEEAWKEAQRFAKSGMCGIQSPEDAWIRIRTGRSLGMPATASVQGIDVIEGRPSLKAKTKVALCMSRRDEVEYFRLLSTSDEESEWEAKRVGDPAIKFKYTIAMADKAKLLNRGKDEAAKANSNWAKHPAAMLRARASAQLADIVAPHLMLGLPSSEEMEDVRADRLECEARGEIAPQPQRPPSQAMESRDWASEVALICNNIAGCQTQDALKALLPMITGFAEEAPKDHADTIREAYKKVSKDLGRGQ